MIHRYGIPLDAGLRTVRVWLPQRRPRAVLYLHDGQKVFGRSTPSHPTWRADEVRLRVEPGAHHHETAWSGRLADALVWLFGA